MTTENGMLSLTIQDYDGEITSTPMYIQFNNDLETLASIASFAQGVMTDLSPLLDGSIVKCRFTWDLTPTGGTPVSGSEIERVGSLTFALADLSGRSYSYEIPAFKYSKFVGNNIPLTDTDVATFVDLVTIPTGSIVVVNEDWSRALPTARFGRKVFRKHRKQTKRT